MATARQKMKKPLIQSTRDQVFQGLKEMILDNTYDPGEVLQIDRLSEEFGVSSTPIREALIRLEGYGLVTLIPNKGARVTEITVDDVRNTWEMRIVLEPYAARITAGLEGLDEEFERLRSSFLRISNGESDLDLYIESDIRLHTLLYEHLSNPFLKETVQRVRQLSMRMRYFPEGVEQIKATVMATVANEHLEIVDALLAHDPERSARAVQKHIEHGRDRALAYMERGPENEPARR
jgi:DNA-binding GntR family transcriptional regulator